jgi:hypothetical protein
MPFSMEYYNKNLDLRKYYTKLVNYDFKKINVFEVTTYENGVWQGYINPNGGRKMSEENKELNKENRVKVLRRIKNKVKKLAFCNFDENSKFITLTFKENITDTKIANYEFNKFIKRLRDKVGYFRYLAVIEYQKRGAVHYHMLSNMDYLPAKELQDIWNNGFIRINRMNDCKNIYEYVAKYLKKSMKSYEEKNLKVMAEKKAYMRSDDLIENKDYKGEVAENKVKENNLLNEKPIYNLIQSHENLGQINYRRYDINKIK